MVVYHESSAPPQLHEIVGDPLSAKESFYKLAASNVHYMSSYEMFMWKIENDMRLNLSPGSFAISVRYNNSNPGDVKRWVASLDIVINKDMFLIKGEDFSDCIPYVLEHEVYEAWLFAKKGIGSSLNEETRHLLSTRHTFLTATRDGVGDRLYEFSMKFYPEDKKIYDDAVAYAKDRFARETSS